MRLILLAVVALLGVGQLVPPTAPVNMRVTQGILTTSSTIVTITAPTSSATYNAGTASTLTTLAGTAQANQPVSACTWTNSLGGSGSATGTTSWTVASIALTVGTNVITVTCPNAAGTGSDVLTVTRGTTDNPIAAGRLPGGTATLPNPSWALAGVEGGIPTRTTVCATLGIAGQSRTFNQTTGGNTVTISEINAAIAACGTNQVVVMETGKYGPYTDGIDFAGNDDVTLRGEGADNTLIYFTDVAECLGSAGHAFVCVRDSGLTYYPSEGSPQNIATWSGGFTQGTTSIQLNPNASAATLPNLSVGMWIHLDQNDDASDTTNVFVCGEPYLGSSGCTQQGSTTMSLPGRAQNQRVKVVSIEGGNCGTTGNGTCDVVVTPGVYMPNIRSGQNPGAWWGASGGLATGVGVEDLSIDGTAVPDGHPFYRGVSFIFAVNSWLRGVRIANCPTPKACVGISGSNHITVEHNYFYGNTYDDIGSTTYGVETFGGTDNLVWNNIFHHRASPLVSDGDQGTVFAYNYSFDDWYNEANCESGSVPNPICNFMQSSNYSHESGNSMILHEGNEGTGSKADIIHGTSNLFTLLRNYFIGWEPNKTNELGPVQLYAFNRYYAYACNVLGKSGTHTDYSSGGNASVWRLGGGYGGISGRPDIPDDSRVASSLFAWGNWDPATSTNDNGSDDQTGTRWSTSGFLPTGDSYLPNPTPGSNTCPSSFFLSVKPTWWPVSIAWPAIGPDVSSGNISDVGGHVKKNPAHACFDAMSDDTEYVVDEYGIRPKHFDRATCYPGS